MINDSINRFLGVLCYPFLSLDEFKKDLIEEYLELRKRENTKEAERTRSKLKSELTEYIRHNYNIYSYDEIYLYLEKCYLYDICGYEDVICLYGEIMKRMANALISHRDGRIVFKYWKNKNDEDLFGGFAGSNKVDLFHSLNCHIPMDVIAIVYMIINQEEHDISCLDYFYGNIEVADQQLARILEKGVAENHLHKGVSRTFSSIWDSLMEPFTVKKSKSFIRQKLVGGTEEQNKHMLFYVLGCGIIRAYLVFRMKKLIDFNEGRERSEENHQIFHEDNMAGAVFDMQEDKSKNGIEMVRELKERFAQGEGFEKYYKEKFSGEDIKEMLTYYIDLWNILADEAPEGVFTDHYCLNVLGENAEIHTFDENIFLYNALYQLLREKETVSVRRCVIQYLRVRNYLFHVSVQQKTIKGLDYFQQEHYSVNSSLNRLNINNYWKNAIREQLQNQYLHKIEFRTSIPDSAAKFRKEVLDFLKAYRDIVKENAWEEGSAGNVYRRIPQVGLVVHFLKRPDMTTPEKCLQKEDCSFYQFGELQETYKKQMDAFIKLRSEFSELSRYLVGIDAASLENSTPVWVFVPVYEKARDSQVEQIGKKQKDGGYTQSLGFTFHAGEDFRHILSGLRRIDEAVEYLKFHAGDRIGHGIALGIPARVWKSQNPVVIIPQIEALENYLWAYDTLSQNYSSFQATIMAYMEKRILGLAGKIYGEREAISADMLISAYHKMFCMEGREAMPRDVDGRIEENLCKRLWEGKKIFWDAGLLAAARHCKKFLREMERPVHFEITEQDLLIIEELQQILKKKLGRKGIVIEVNPSSNTAIADIDKLQENQLYQINKINDGQNVMVCINSDDPAVFNTNVSNELAYIYYGMLEQNISREAALLWIDRIRENGINSSFIRHQEPDHVLVQKLDELIKRM